MTLPPQRHYRSAKERSIARIPSGLRSAIADAAEGRAPWPLTILGSVGSGKTCAALALCDHVYGSVYETFRGHCDLLRDAQDGRGMWVRTDFAEARQYRDLRAHQVWNGYRASPLVVVDEIGSREKVSDFQYDCLYDMLEVREFSPLVLISNLSMAALALVFDERITSRMIAGTVVTVEGDDLRDPRTQR